MHKAEFSAIEAFMHTHMNDAAHDKFHVYRVLNFALEIAAAEAGVNFDVLIAAALLHDIGRERQFADPSLCHAQTGGEMARTFLTARGWEGPKADHVQACITTHRFRQANPPATLEAKIIFDADKLDAAGALGIARTLIYCGQMNEILYTLDESNHIITENDNSHSETFFQEYTFKLQHVYDKFYTPRANEIAAQMQKTAQHFHKNLHAEITDNHQQGVALLNKVLTRG